MKEKDLKRILQQSYSFKNWKELLPLFFKKVEYLSRPESFALADDRIIKGDQVGRIKLDDNKSLAIFDVEVTDNVVISRNRKELRDIAIKHIDQDITHGAIVFFHSPNQQDYRFSFVSKWSALDMETGEFIKGETKPKRYTYLLGLNEACTTAAKRLLTLIQKKEAGNATIKELQQVFSVEALNREFFKSYKSHFEKFWKYLAESKWREGLIDHEKKENDKQEKPIRDFVKKLLGRIVFLHFLQKKGWMGCSSESNEWLDGKKRFIQLLFEEFTSKEQFHSQCLTKLFFETLNTKRPNGGFYIDGLDGELNGSHVPYLNGGLFEPEKNKTTLKVDFPVHYFEELLAFFEQYNFTIDENSPDDHEVGIDPEMLGHIFENLLEENRAKGAFYTPKEIVQYMCQESLIQYLYNHFGKQQYINEFIRKHAVSSILSERDNASKVNQLLDDIKVCDPAIGSGAFPIGMLQEIFDAKRFIYPFLRTNQPFNPAITKKNIIQNSIYGVDIEKGAVDIAQLRFWLALVVEEVNPHPLPNLDYKIMQGNSLLEQYEGIDLSNTALMEAPTTKNVTLFEEPETEYGFSEENRDSIKQLVKDYFEEEDKDEKTRIHKAIDRIVLDHIDKSLEGYENRLLIEIAAAERALSRKRELKQNTTKVEKEIAKRQKLLENKERARKNLVKYEETEERPYFLWHLYFMDVFEQGGFDVMIGNPPYIQIQKMEEMEKLAMEEAKYNTYTRTGDIYCLFYEKGFDLLDDDGTLTYITSNKWMRGGYGKSLRKFFSETNTLKILDLGPGIFHSATVDTNIYVGKNNGFENNVKGIAIGNRFELAQLDDEDLLPLDDVGEDAWVVLSPLDLDIKEHLIKKGRALRDWDIKINFGIKTGYNQAFIIPKGKRDELIMQDRSAEEIVRPILKGREIEPYHAEWNGDYVINAHNGFKTLTNERVEPINVQEEYLSIWQYLQEMESGLFEKKRSEPKTKLISERADQGWHWTNLRNCAYLHEFKKEKVIWKRIGSIMRFAYSDEEIYCLDSTCIATGEKIKFLTAVLNSKTGLYQLFKTSPQTGTGDQIISVQALEPMLVPYPDEETETLFNRMVDYILFIRKEKEPVLESKSNEDLSNRFEEIIDMMVYELYFEEEMKAKELDVLHFINEKAFPDIIEMKPEEKKNTIQKVYYELQQKDNQIRNRILVSESRSEIIQRINEVTGS